MYGCAWKMTFPSGNALMLGFASSPQPTCTKADVRKQAGVSLKDITQTEGDIYNITHQVGNWAKSMGYDGILAPSARNPTGTNVVIF